VALEPRDELRRQSYALVEHCRAISVRRLQSARLAQLDPTEIGTITRKLRRLIGE
jgi:mRNA interferase MazF